MFFLILPSLSKSCALMRRQCRFPTLCVYRELFPKALKSTGSQLDPCIFESESLARLSSSSSSCSTSRESRDDIAVTEWMKPGETAVFCFEMFPPWKTKLPESKKSFDCSGVKTEWFKISQRKVQENDSENESDNEALDRIESGGRYIVASSSPGKFVTGSVVSYLVIHGVKLSDGGEYLSVGKDQHGETNCKFRLIIMEDELVHKKSTCVSPRFVKAPTAQSVPEGSDALIKCTVLGKPAPIVYWYMYGTRIYNGERHRFLEESTDASLKVLSARWYDNGKYEVRAINPLGEATCTVDLSVEPNEHQEVEFEGAPMFLKRTQTALLKVGSTVSFDCTVAGTPKPIVYWKKGDTVVTAKDNTRYRISEKSGGGYSFVVKRARLTDCGKYVCVAENDRGIAICAAFLTLGDTDDYKGLLSYDIPPLAPVFVTRPHGVIVRTGYSAMFQCTIHGIPEPKVTWYTPAGRKIEIDQHFVVENIHSHHTLRISKVNAEDTGNYFCCAVNHAGEVSCSAKLDVTMREKSVAPSIRFGANAMKTSLAGFDVAFSANRTPNLSERKSSTSKSVTLNAGKNAKISLTVKGYPRPQVTWHKDGKPLKSGNRFSLQNNNDVYQLRITRVCLEDQGLYSVLACNAGGLYTTLLQVSVKEKLIPPVFAKPPQPTVALHEGADAFIQCLLHDNAVNKQTTWWKADENLKDRPEKYEMESQGAMRQLTVKSVTNEDGGEYRCQVGEQSALTELRICSEEEDVQSKQERKSERLKIVSGPAPPSMKVPEKGTLILQQVLSEEVATSMWTLNGKNLTTCDRAKITRNGTKHSLMLMHVCAKDAGEIKFIVPESDIFVTTALTVQELPRVPDKLEVIACEDTSIKVKWEPTRETEVDFEVELYSEATKFWKKIGEVPSESGEFTTKSVDPGISYKFRLTAQNNIGCKSVTSESIDIAQKVKIIQGLENVEIEDGETARFNVQLNQASATGDWFMNGLKLSPRGESCQMLTSGNAHSLIMRNLTRTGNATVQFKTKKNEQVTSAQLLVQGKTLSVMQPFTDINVTENAEAVFTLGLSRHVKKVGKWFHKGLELDQSHDVIIEKRGEYQILHLKNIRNTASGEIRFELPGEPQVTNSAQLIVQGWFEIEPFQKITCSLPDVTPIRIGDDAVISVKLSSDKPCSFSWTHNGKPVVPKSKKYKIKQRGDKISLKISKITEGDEGILQCIVDKDKASTKLIFQEIKQDSFPPVEDFVTFVEDKNGLSSIPIKLLEGDSPYELTCQLSNKNGKVKWMKNGKPLDLLNSNIEIIEDGCFRKLKFNNVNCDESGFYECIVGNEKKAKMTFSVSVDEISFVGQIADNVIKSCVECEKNVELSCVVSHESAKVEWKKDGKLVDKANKIFTVIESGCVRKLEIHDVTTDVAGLYDCVIATGDKAKNRSFTVSVESLHFVDDESVTSAGRHQMILEGEHDAKLSCQLSHPKVKVQWKKNGIPIDPEKENVKVIETGCSRDLIFSKVVENTAGCYECVILSGHSECKKSFDVTVQRVDFDTSKNNLSPEKLTFVEGDKNFQLCCEVSHPDVEVQWTKDDIPVKISDICLKTKSEGCRRKLTVGEVKASTAGTYKCVIVSDTTNKAKIFEVFVESTSKKSTSGLAAGFIDDSSDSAEEMTVLEGAKDVELSARLSHSNVIVDWEKDGIPIDINNGGFKVVEDGAVRKLVLREITGAMSGTYHCVLKSGHNIIRKPFEVAVQAVNFDCNSSPEFFKVTEGKSEVAFPCQVSHNDVAVEWRRNGIPLDLNDDGFRVEDAGRHRNLVISNITPDLSGTYDCVIMQGNKRKTKSFHILVEGLDFIKDENGTIQNLMFKKGDRNVEIVSTISHPNGVVNWRKDGVFIDTNRQEFESKTDNCKRGLVISNISRETTGTYECVLISHGTEKVQTFEVEMEEPQQRIISFLCSSDALKEGDSLRLQAYVDLEDAVVEWFRDDISLTSIDKRLSLTGEGTFTSELYINKVKVEDAGVYSCRTSHDSCSVTVRVEALPVKFTQFLKDVVAISGSDATLVCKISDASKEVEWFKGGSKIEPNEKYLFMKKESIRKLVVRNLNRLDTASYHCKTKNASTECSLVVEAVLFVDDAENTEHAEYYEGDKDVEICCELSHPDAKTIWMKNGTPINSTDKNIKVADNGCARKLIFSQVISDIAGRYTCFLDGQEKKFDVSVKEFGFMETMYDRHNEFYSFKESDGDVELPCFVTHPDVQVEWRKDGIVINEGEGNFSVIEADCVRRLCFKEVTPDSAGCYECVIAVGDQKKVKSFHVAVEEHMQCITSVLPSNVKLFVGDKLHLKVNVEPARSEVMWLKDGLVITENKEDDRVKVAGDGEPTRILEISHLKLDDAGVYSCETIHESCCTEVAVEEPVVEVVNDLQDGECEEKGTVTFEVRLSRAPKISPQWSLNGKKIFPSSNRQISARELLYSVTLRDLQKTDSGVITFEADSVKKSSQLIVRPPPAKFVKRLNEEMTVTSGSDAIFVCEIATDAASVQWMRDGSILDGSRKYAISQEGRLCKLRIKKLTLEDSGTYHCKSDVDRTSCALQVEKPVLKVIEGLNDVIVMEDEKASFWVRLSTPNVDVIWMKNGKKIMEKLNRSEIRSEGCWYALHMRRLSTQDSGEVKVVADGKELDYAFLQVKKPPVCFTRDVRDLVVDLKEDAEFVCEVTDPDGEVTWYRNDAEVNEANNLNMEIYSQGVVRKLYIPRAFMHHEAKYSCVTNDGIRTSAELFVKVPPVTVVQPLSDVRAYIGDDVKFSILLSTSEVEGEWLIDSNPLNESDEAKFTNENAKRTLQLRKVSESRIITYKVDNNISSSCRLDVRERPVAIERRLSDMAAREGDDVVFECFFSKPDLPVVWYVDDELLEPSKKYEVQTSGCKHTLKVHDVRYDDEANYSCKYRHRRTSSDLTVLEPRIDVIKALSDVACNEGDSCILECILSHPATTVSWCKDGRPLMVANARVTETQQHVIHELMLENLNIALGGSYSITNLNKTLSSAEVRVTRRAIRVVQPLNDVVVHDDIESVTLVCVFSQTPFDVMWTKDGQEIKQNSSNYFVENDGAIQRLTVSPKALDQSTYSCVVPKQCETSCQVKVGSWKLEIVKNLPEELTLVEGDEAEFTCSFSISVGSDEVMWFIDEYEIDVAVEENVFEMSHRGSGTTLYMPKVEKQLNNKIISMKCRNLASHCRLEVITIPDAPTSLELFSETSSAILSWSRPEDDGGRPITDYVIQTKAVEEWKECKIPVNMQDKNRVTSVVKDLPFGITYWLRVAAVNEAGVGQFSVFEQTFCPEPVLSFQRELNDITINEGQNLELWCELSRDTHDDTQWTLNNVPIEEDFNQICCYSYNLTRELVIENATVAETGTYRCTVGNASSLCRVVVEPQLIHFLTTLKDMVSRVEEDIRLSCVVSSSAVDVSWYKNGLHIKESPKCEFLETGFEKALIINSCDLSDTATYGCDITGFHGEIISNKANVLVMPKDCGISSNYGHRPFVEDLDSDVFLTDVEEEEAKKDDRGKIIADKSSTSSSSKTRNEDIEFSEQSYAFVDEKYCSSCDEINSTDDGDKEADESSSSLDPSHNELYEHDAVYLFPEDLRRPQKPEESVRLQARTALSPLAEVPEELMTTDTGERNPLENEDENSYFILQDRTRSENCISSTEEEDEIYQQTNLADGFVEEENDVNGKNLTDKGVSYVNWNTAVSPENKELDSVENDDLEKFVPLKDDNVFEQSVVDKDFFDEEVNQFDESTDLITEVKKCDKDENLIDFPATKEQNRSMEAHISLQNQALGNYVIQEEPYESSNEDVTEVYNKENIIVAFMETDPQIDIKSNFEEMPRVLEDDDISPAIDKTAQSQFGTDEYVEPGLQSSVLFSTSFITPELTSVTAEASILAENVEILPEIGCQIADLANKTQQSGEEDYEVIIQAPNVDPKQEEVNADIVHQPGEVGNGGLVLDKFITGALTGEKFVSFEESVSIKSENVRSDVQQDSRRKRSSLASMISDAYETATESMNSDGDSYESAFSEPQLRCKTVDPVSLLPSSVVEALSCSQAADDHISLFDDPDQTMCNTESMHYQMQSDSDQAEFETNLPSGDESEYTVSSFSSRAESPKLTPDLPRLSLGEIMSVKDDVIKLLQERQREEALKIEGDPNNLLQESNVKTDSFPVDDQRTESLTSSCKHLCTSGVSDNTLNNAACLKPSCVMIPVSLPQTNNEITTVVIDAKTGDTITTTSMKIATTTLDLLSAEPISAIALPPDGRYDDIHLPQESPFEKLARLFGGEQLDNENCSPSNDGFLFKETVEEVRNENRADESIPLQAREMEQDKSEFTDNHPHTSSTAAVLLESCMQALETIQVTSKEVLAIDSETEEFDFFQNNRSKQLDQISPNTWPVGLSPGFTLGLHNQQAVVGNTVIFFCTVSAFPLPNIHWRKEGDEEEVMLLSEGSSGIEITTISSNDKHTDCTLKIHRVTMLDAGLYSCHATNENGKSACSAVLRVTQDDKDDVVLPLSHDYEEESFSIWKPKKNEGSAMYTESACEGYLTDDDVSIHMPPRSECSYAWSIQPPDPECSHSQLSKGDEETTPLSCISRDIAENNRSSKPNQLPLKIHVLESIVVRESYSTTESDASSCTPASRTTSLAGSVAGSLNSRKYRKVVLKRSSRPSTASSFFRDSDSDCESVRSLIKTPDIYYAIASCGAEGDSASLELRCGQSVEVMDSSSSREWLVRTRPSKHVPIKMGFVDPAYLSCRLFTPSPLPPGNLLDASNSFGLPRPEKDHIGSDKSKKEVSINVPVNRFLFDKPTFLVPPSPFEIDSSEASSCKKSLVEDLIQEEENFIDYLKTANYIIANASNVPTDVDLNSHQLFGDLEGFEQFHSNILLPELQRTISSPQNLPHVFMRHSPAFEQLHLSHLVNTHYSHKLVCENDKIASGLVELSEMAGTDLVEAAQKPDQQITLYQYYLKKLLRRMDHAQGPAQVLHDAISMLSDIPYMANTTRLWQAVTGHPAHASEFGKLIKEGTFQLVDLDERDIERKSRIRRVFLFENIVVFAKINIKCGSNNSDESQFDRMYNTTKMSLDVEPSGADVKTFTLKFIEQNNVGTACSTNLRSRTLAMKKTWCRALENIISHENMPQTPEKPYFQHPLSDVTIPVAADLQLFCYIAGNPKSSVTWCKDGQTLNADQAKRTKRDNGYCALYVNHVTANDAGVYGCHLSGDVKVSTSCSVKTEK
ncbi:obscurin-like [Clavelina lepadiformis]|uniref:obscurin-like n=1 Tax=Clavelina lepadiformis TaxID=159417 RepID=UPI0040416966